jgi:hypothetical protein
LPTRSANVPCVDGSVLARASLAALVGAAMCSAF